eukprot:scaffold35113_cov36-Phaeocystis_antarctica.AAC.1
MADCLELVEPLCAERQDGLRLLGAALDAPPRRTQQLLAALAARVVQLVRGAGCDIAHLRAE